MKISVAVIGACCTRDCFNSKFIPEWKDHFDVCMTRFQPSIISIMSKPIPFSRRMMEISYDNDNRLYSDMLIDECRKDLLNQLISTNPDAIILDFYSDAYNGVINVNNYTYITNKTKEWSKNPLFASWGGKSELSSWDECTKDEYLSLWRKKFDEFWDFVNTYLCKAGKSIPVYLNPVKATNKIYENKKIKKFTDINIKSINEAWKIMDDYAISKGAIKLDYGGKEYCSSDAYPFGGRWIVHFEKDYYRALFNSMLETIKVDKKNTKIPGIYNLLLNSSGQLGSLYWRFIYGSFSFDRAKRIITIDNNELKKTWCQMWSPEIETSGVRKKYCVSFEALVEGKLDDSDKCIWGIRTFEKRNLCKRSESVNEYKMKAKYEDGLWHKYHIELELGAKEKFFSIGPLVCGTGRVSYKNIKVRHWDEKEYEINFKIDNASITERLLLGNSDYLIDTNCMNVFNVSQVILHDDILDC